MRTELLNAATVPAVNDLGWPETPFVTQLSSKADGLGSAPRVATNALFPE